MKWISYLIAGYLLLNTSLIYSESKQDNMNLESGNFIKGKYRNIPEVGVMSGSYWTMMKDWITGKEIRSPKQKLPVIPINPDSIFSHDTTELRVILVSHSTLILEIDGLKLMMDPVLSDDPSPVPLLFPMKRFQGKAPITPELIPELDVVIISHDHYDHLDKRTIEQIHHKTGLFIVPLGVDEHLKKWGVPENKIKTLDWESSVQIKDITITATPAQHFSGRGLFSRNKTLWASWVISGPHHKVYFSGDSGYFPGFKTIGDKYGPFDITFLDCAQYAPQWEPVHMFPHQTINAHRDLKGKILIPIHWGTFKLSFHDWFEPAEKITKLAGKSDIPIIIPIPGEIINPGNYENKSWWEKFK
jgi:L-ascorbate metabolism protein UlaG (beta-lactamase superfamily)